MFRTAIHTWFRRPSRRPLRQRRLRLESLESRTNPSQLSHHSGTILVDDDAHQFHHPDFHTIQEAVDAAGPGDHILVAAGTYEEQVVIPSSDNNLDLRAIGNAVITAPDTFGDASNAIVHVDGATGVRIWGFRIQGSGATTGPNFGILVDGGGSADLRFNRITDIRDNPLTGRQEGVAIQFGQLTSGGSGSGRAMFNTIDNYQKGGIVVIGEGSSADISFNSIRGVGATDVIAQNGIQVSDGATANVERNVVSGNKFTGEDFESVGILVFNSSNVRIRGNTTFNNDEGILLFGDSGTTVSDVTVDLNTSFNNTFNGIGASGVSNVTIRNNSTNHNGFDGINLELATNVQVIGNRAFFNGRDGIALEDTATDNIVRNNFMFFNTMFDAFDASTGNGTAGTANTWEHNHFHTSSPNGLR